MSTFTYQGFDAAGARTKGEMSAGSIEEVEHRLAQLSVTPTSIVGHKAKKAAPAPKVAAPKSKAAKSSRKVTDADRAGVLRDMATMVAAGVPFVETIEAVLDAQTKSGLVGPLNGVKASIIEGGSISSSIRAAGNLFPPLVSDVIGVAEKGGKLDDALANAASYLERAADLKRKISNAMMYPMVMAGISTVMTAVIIVFVIPQFTDLFSKTKAALPITTKAMLAVGDYVHKQPLVSAAITVGTILTLVALFRTRAAKAFVGRFALRVPGLGDLLLRLGLARALRVMATLLGSGVPVMTALEHGAKVAGIPPVTAALEASIEAVRTGGNLSDALRKASCIPATVTQMVVVGERTGRLTSLLGASAEKMETEADARLKSLVAIIEPLMILLMGFVVGGITISIITPIYSAVGNTR